jgi:hypothetical protein
MGRPLWSLLLLPGVTTAACSWLAPSDAELRARSARDGGARDAAGQAVDAMSDAGADPDADAASDAPCSLPCESPAVCVLRNGVPQCENAGAALDSQRWELPCGTIFDYDDLCLNLPAGATACPTDPAGFHPVDRSVRFGGQPGAVYDVTLHFRGLVEPKTYTDGAALGEQFYSGGSPVPSNFNVYSLTISDPERTYYLNSAEGQSESRRVLRIDYQQTLRIAAGATVTLRAYDSNCSFVRNCADVLAPTCEPLIVPGVPPAPAAYNGQFVQMNVLSVTARRGEPADASSTL